MVVAILNGNYTLSFRMEKGSVPVLLPANDEFRDLRMKDGDELSIWVSRYFVIRSTQ